MGRVGWSVAEVEGTDDAAVLIPTTFVFEIPNKADDRQWRCLEKIIRAAAGRARNMLPQNQQKELGGTIGGFCGCI